MSDMPEPGHCACKFTSGGWLKKPCAWHQAMAKDAERYRWLRSCGKFAPSVIGRGWALTTGSWGDTKKEEHMKTLDAAIDDAMNPCATASNNTKETK